MIDKNTDHLVFDHEDPSVATGGVFSYTLTTKSGRKITSQSLGFNATTQQKDDAIREICKLGDADNTEGLRYNRGKARVTLVPFEVLLALAEHYTIGAEKYEDNNWRKGLKYNDTMDCAMRHIIAFQTGENMDEETGSHHLIAAIWNLVALHYFELYPDRYKEFDNRWTSSSIPIIKEITYE